jgi:hypothetical protein
VPWPESFSPAIYFSSVNNMSKSTLKTFLHKLSSIIEEGLDTRNVQYFITDHTQRCCSGLETWELFCATNFLKMRLAHVTYKFVVWTSAEIILYRFGLNSQNLTAVVKKIQRIVSVVGSTAIFFAVQKMFCYHLRQKVRRCSVQKFFDKLLKLSVCTDYCNCGLMLSLTCCWVASFW